MRYQCLNFEFLPCILAVTGGLQPYTFSIRSQDQSLHAASY